MAHFCLVLIYAFPLKNSLNSRFDYWAYTYCYPYFHQDYRLFTPVPQNNYLLYVSYTINNKPYHSFPLREVMNEKSIFTGSEFLLLSLSASCNYITPVQPAIKGNVYKMNLNKEYFVLKQVLENYLNHKHHQTINDLKITLTLSSIKTKEKTVLID